VLDELLFPAEWRLSIQRLEHGETTITICIGSTKDRAACPGCGTESDRIHSVYERRPTDLPLVAGQLHLNSEYLEQIGFTPSSTQTLGFDTHLERGFVLKEIKRDMAQDSEVLRAVA
jgi:hypothetical protein